jgi:hypothetical protein
MHRISDLIAPIYDEASNAERLADVSLARAAHWV